MKVMGRPIEHFSVPHPAPEEVEAASAKFEEISAAFRAASAKFYALTTSRLDDITAANKAAADARLAGVAPPRLTPDKIDANLADAELEMNVLSEACDLAHTALLEAVAEHRDEWVKVYEAAEVEAEHRLAGLIDLTEQASSDVSAARSAARWLAEFTGTGGQSQFPGSGGHSVSDFAKLRKVVNGETRLVGYRDSEPIWETVKS